MGIKKHVFGYTVGGQFDMRCLHLCIGDIRLHNKDLMCCLFQQNMCEPRDGQIWLLHFIYPFWGYYRQLPK
jgi:hypothetical protein